MGSMISNGLGQVGTGLSSAAQTLGQETGLSNLGQGIVDLFGGQASPPSDFVGPQSPEMSPTFMQAFAQGFLGHNPSTGAGTPTVGSEVGGGIGQLLNLLSDIAGSGGGGRVAPAQLMPGSSAGSIEILPGYAPASAPQGGLIHNLIKSYTFGLLNSQLGGVAGIGGR